jgi:hypothetical protein
LLEDFYDQKIDIDRINYGVITLVPKGSDADRIQKFRPICLLNVIFKIVTKIMVNRVIPSVGEVIKASQTAFLKGRYILDGVTVLHEILNDIHVKK